MQPLDSVAAGLAIAAASVPTTAVQVSKSAVITVKNTRISIFVP